MKIGIIVLQILFIHVFLFLGAAVKHILPLPMPGSMYGLALLFIAMMTGIVKLEWVEKGGNWLLAELLLFFVPSAVGIMNYDEIFSWQGAESIILICLSTFIVMGVTAFISERMHNKRRSETQ
ncbi:CidA/LrgA family protein [Peribacillus sp. SCS-155]|uniref:CidA/LrgA family protein n=1 Tax=Peribacillus sedimenti TaxID=3115297 RepID=UPI003905E08F